LTRLGRTSRFVIVGVAAAAVLAAAAGAAAVGLVSGRIAIFTKSVSHGTCNLTSTSVSDDSYTQEQNPNTTAGTNNVISVKSRTSQQFYAWIRFDLTACSFPTDAQVDSATLTLVPTASTSRTVAAARVTGTWAEGTITWSTSPSVSSATTATTTITSNTAKTWDVSTDVDDFVSGVATNYGWRLWDTGASSTTTTSFSSKENGTTTKRPTLTVTYAY
jgi:hypothetical protein